MTTETLTFNRNDWSGRNVTIEVDREARTFKLDGMNFRWEVVVEDDEDFVCETFRVKGEGWPDDYVLAKASKLTWKNHPRLSDKHWIAGQMGIERDDTDPVIACAQVLCNTI